MNKKIRSLLIFVIDILILVFSFFFTIWLKPASLRVYLPNYFTSFLIFGSVWLIFTLVIQKFSRSKLNIRKQVIKLLKTNVFSLAFFSIIIVVFKLHGFSRLIFLGTILLVTVLEIIFLIFINSYNKLSRKYDVSTNLSAKSTIIEDDQVLAEEPQLEFPEIEDVEDSVLPNLAGDYLQDKEELFEFIRKNIPLQNINEDSTLLLNTHTLFNIKHIQPLSQQLFINLHKTNDMRWINKYFIQVNQNLQPGGFFVGHAVTIETRYQRIKYDTSKIWGNLLFPLDFLIHRVLPKLPVIKSIYFVCTKGSNRAISKAEVLGRLQFCGFKLAATKEIENSLYFIAQKVTKPREDKNPSYGPLIKLKRIGKDGDVIYIYKFRTMHPYSEYLQDFVHKSNDLQKCGKFQNDYRVTSWSKTFRKLFLDELPQIINFFRGEVGLVGVRALSEHYFSLYPKDLQKLRIKFKPGLVPPFYVDMPETFEEILESERKYLKEKEKHPILTDIKYFFKAWWNIVFKGARSK